MGALLSFTGVKNPITGKETFTAGGGKPSAGAPACSLPQAPRPQPEGAERGRPKWPAARDRRPGLPSIGLP